MTLVFRSALFLLCALPVACSGSSSRSAAGDDGVRPSPRVFITGLAYGGGAYVMTLEIDDSDLEYHGAIYRSTDGTNFTRVADDLSVVPTHVVYANGRFVAIGRKYDSQTSSWAAGAFDSDDGERWSETPVPAAFLSGLAFGRGIFVTAGDQGHLRSVDGVTWTNTGVAPSFNIFSGFLGFAADVFVSCPDRNCVIGSGDGDWQPVTMISQGQLEDRIFRLSRMRVVNNAFLGAASYDCCFGETPDAVRWRKLSSANGVDWTLDREEFRNDPPEIVYDDGSLCIAFSESAIQTGPSCEMLATTFEEPNFQPEFIVAEDGRFLVAGSRGIVSSSNGRVWTRVLASDDIEQ